MNCHFVALQYHKNQLYQPIQFRQVCLPFIQTLFHHLPDPLYGIFYLIGELPCVIYPQATVIFSGGGKHRADGNGDTQIR
jgi:hypothetical protein